MHRIAVFCLTTAAILAVAVTAAHTTPAKDAPWLPEAAAYRLTLFLGNLTPVSWVHISDAWSEPYRGSDIAKSALGRLQTGSAVDTSALEAAIELQDRQALFAAATRLIAMRIEEELNRAMAAGAPASAQRSITEARGLYRAFSDHVRAADPDTARRIGLAWLELSSSAGSSGVLGAGAHRADEERMVEARGVISGYIATNYLPDAFAPRKTLSAIPEWAARNGQTFYVPPSLPPGSDIFDQDPLPRLVLNFEEQGIDETDLPLIAFGDMLFDSPLIFGSPARDVGIACSTCHNRSDINNRFFIPGVSHQAGAVDVDGAFFNPLFNDRRVDPLDIPSLRGLRFTAPYGRDGRFASLRDFTRNVIVNEFGGEEPTPFILDSLMAYLLEFDFLPNLMLTPDGKLTEKATEAARRGEKLFDRPFAGLDGKSCAACHIPSSNFLDRRAHDIGSVIEAYEGSRAGAMDTPTLLGSTYTAPYFHDGSLPTLASVVDWFDETKNLDLSERDRADLTAYLETVGAADEPYEEFQGRNTPFRLAFAELTTFASTLNTLLPARDTENILLLVDTVAADLAADAGTMSNLEARPDIQRLSDILFEVGQAVSEDDWATAGQSWRKYRIEAAKVAERAY